MKNGTYEHRYKGSKKKYIKDKDKLKIIKDFYYILPDNRLQITKASLKKSIREYRLYYFKWLKLFSEVKIYLDIEFKQAVGKEKIYGHGIKMKKDETINEAFNRYCKEIEGKL